MKKTIVLVLLIFLLSIPYFSRAQQSYVRISVGYAMPMGSQLLAIESTSQTNSFYDPQTGASTYTDVDHSKGIYGSYGSGFTLNAAFGYMFSNNLGIDLTANYLFGDAYKGFSKLTENDNGAVQTYSSTSKEQLEGIFFTPALLLTTGDGNFKPYLKTGIVIGFATMRKEFTSDVPDYIRSQVGEAKGGVQWGFRGGIGVSTDLGKRVSFFTEILFTSMSFDPKENEIIEYIENGESILETIPESQRSISLKKEVTYSFDSENPDEDPEAEALKYPLPLGSLTLNAGISIKLGKLD